jgi:anti-anti-sigma factor
MKIEYDGETLRVCGVKELDAASAAGFHDAIKAAMTPAVRHIEIDLSDIAFLDSSGLGTLVALRKLTGRRGGVVRVLEPTGPAQQVLELTRLYRVLEVVRRDAMATASG